MSARDEILQIVHGELSQSVPPEAFALADRIRDIYGSVVRGVLFYGSCLRDGCDDGLLDLYVFVDRYRGTYASPWLALLNRLLPPNVFYLEVAVGERVVRAKYAVLALRDLGRFTSPRCFEPYFWARFAQPCALVFASDDGVRDRVANALVEAILTFVRRGVPLVAPSFTSRDLWVATWQETYRGELRPERPGILDTLWVSCSQRYEQVTERALRVAGFSAQVAMEGDTRRYEVLLSEGSRRRTLLLWWLRRLQGKVRSLGRILRNGLIFEGGVDYILWKIERHSGIQTDSNWRSKRFPLLGLVAEFWRLYKAGAFR